MLSVTLVSGSMGSPYHDHPPMITKMGGNTNRYLMQGILRQDEEPMHLVLTNLLSRGYLNVDVFQGTEEEHLNHINMLCAGESLIVHSHEVGGVHHELVSTSHKSLEEDCIGRRLTRSESNRCKVIQNGQLTTNRHSLDFGLSVTPTTESKESLHSLEVF